MKAARALVLCIIFFVTGISLIPLLGIQNDEALFAYAVFPPRAGAYILHFGFFEVPLMIMSYVGALKAWIYRLVFPLFGTGVWAVRIPMPLRRCATRESISYRCKRPIIEITANRFQGGGCQQ